MMEIDVDSNTGGDCYNYQLIDDRFFLIVWVDKSEFEERRNAIQALNSEKEAVFGTIRCGE
jgi:hypothetical protein